MLVVSQDRHKMKMVAGAGGWSNSISWLLMLEDLTIIQNFTGKELGVTTGLGFQEEETMLELVKGLSSHSASGLVVNTGFYIKDEFVLVAKQRLISGKVKNQMHSRRYHSFFHVFVKDDPKRNKTNYWKREFMEKNKESVIETPPVNVNK